MKILPIYIDSKNQLKLTPRGCHEDAKRKSYAAEVIPKAKVVNVVCNFRACDPKGPKGAGNATKDFNHSPHAQMAIKTLCDRDQIEQLKIKQII